MILFTITVWQFDGYWNGYKFTQTWYIARLKIRNIIYGITFWDIGKFAATTNGICQVTLANLWNYIRNRNNFAVLMDSVWERSYWILRHVGITFLKLVFPINFKNLIQNCFVRKCQWLEKLLERKQMRRESK